MIGRTLSHFKITAKLGEGGMGEVYRAEDPKLGRDVAIKVLPEAFVADPERLARFEREAKVLASLSHQAIAGIHQVEEAEGQHFLVMELAPGETLAEKIGRGPVPLDEVIPIATQIAEGLEAAHAHGVVHRDLKPANVKVTDDGKVKILDFGLAKALAPESPDSAPGALSRSPTLTADMTRAGMILGTAAYMSPEQARGRQVDKRADVWAFGAVLFEMLTGKPAFPGDNVTDVLAAVVQRDPDWALLPSPTPEPLRRLLRRCLARDAGRRLRDIGDALLELDAAERGEDLASAVTAPRPSPLQRLALGLLAALAAGAAFWLGGRFAAGPAVSAPRTVVHTSVRLPEGVQLAGWSSPAVALSPDERTIAFVGFQDWHQRLYLRRLDEQNAVVVPDSDGAEGPFFSPDSRWVAFGAGSISGRASGPPLLKRAPATGGPAQQVAPITDYFGGSWGDDGFLYFVDSAFKGQLLRVRAEGGKPEPIFDDDRGKQLAATVFSWPQHLPGRRRLLVTTLKDARGGGTATLDLETGELRALGDSAIYARYAPSGHLIFAQADGALRAALFDPETSRILGAPVTLIRDIAFTANDAAVFAVGSGGSALYATGFVRGSNRLLSRLVRIDPTGTIERLPADPDAFTRGLSLDPEGRRVVTATWEGSLWIYDLARGTRLKLPDGGVSARKGRPLWSPDGSTIVFSADRPELDGILLYAQAADGTGAARLLAGDPGENWAVGWTPDGREVIYYHWFGGEIRHYRIAVSAPGSPEPIPMRVAGRVSPDGRWLAYNSGETGRQEVYLEPFPDGGAVIPVSSGGGLSPRWSATGDEIYYERECQYFALSVATGPEPRLGAERFLFEHCDPMSRRGTHYEVGPDGSFYMLEALPDSGLVTSLELVLHWTDTLAAAFGEG